MSDERQTPPDRQDDADAPGDAKPLGQDVPHRNYSEDEEAAMEQNREKPEEEQNQVIRPDS